MRFKLSSRTSLGIGATLSATALAAAALGVSDAGAKTIAHASTTPTAKAVNPATKLNGTVLNVGDQAGTGAEAVLEAAGLIKSTGSTTGVLADGLKVSWADFTAGPPIVAAIAAGDLDIGGVGDAPPVFADPTGKIVIVGALKTAYANAALLVPANSTITSVSQLAGKTVAVGVGTSADYHLFTVLAKAGLTEKDVTIDSASGAAGLAALQSGSVAAFDTWSPWVEDAEADGAKVLATGAPYGSPYSYQVASETALKNPEKVLAIRDYLTELDKAYVWVKAHPLFWAKAWSSVTGLPLAVSSQATLDDPSTPIAVTSTIVQQEQDLINAFSAGGEIPASYPIAPYVTSAFSDSVTGKWPAPVVKKKTTKTKKK